MYSLVLRIKKLLTVQKVSNGLSTWTSQWTNCRNLTEARITLMILNNSRKTTTIRVYLSLRSLSQLQNKIQKKRKTRLTRIRRT